MDGTISTPLPADSHPFGLREKWLKALIYDSGGTYRAPLKALIYDSGGTYRAPHLSRTYRALHLSRTAPIVHLSRHRTYRGGCHQILAPSVDFSYSEHRRWVRPGQADSCTKARKKPDIVRSTLTRQFFYNILRNMLHIKIRNTIPRLVTTAFILSLSNPQFVVLEAATSTPSTIEASQAANASAPPTSKNHADRRLPESLSVSEQRTVVDGLSKVLRASYLYPDKAEKMAKALASFSTEVLVEPIDAHDLASLLTERLYELSSDLHFFVGLDEDWIAEQRLLDNPEKKREIREKEEQFEEQHNFFFKEVKVLEGNVGYLSFNRFPDPELGHQTLAASMTFLSHCDAFIVDLRNNNGGVLEMAQLLASYFLSSETDQPLFDFYYFEDGHRVERKQWVLPSVPGQRQLDAPLYILVSSTSFSAAEWFAFTLRALGRAEIIGEQTAGGAHPVDRKAIDNRFIVNVPIGAIRGPGGGQDFEGVGVEPDEAIAAHEALDLAHKRALETLMAQDSESRTSYEWLFPIIEARRRPVELHATQIDAFIGDYSGRTILTEDGALYYTWNGKSKVRLTPLSPSLFALDGIDDFRIRFIVSEGEVTALERVYADGRAPKVQERTEPMEN